MKYRVSFIEIGLVLSLMVLAVVAGLIDRARPQATPLLISAAAADGQFCDLSGAARPPLVEPPRGKYDYRMGVTRRGGGVA